MSWNCRACTFTNSNGDRRLSRQVKCEMCNILRPRQQHYQSLIVKNLPLAKIVPKTFPVKIVYLEQTHRASLPFTTYARIRVCVATFNCLDLISTFNLNATPQVWSLVPYHRWTIRDWPWYFFYLQTKTYTKTYTTTHYTQKRTQHKQMLLWWTIWRCVTVMKKTT